MNITRNFYERFYNALNANIINLKGTAPLDSTCKHSLSIFSTGIFDELLLELRNSRQLYNLALTYETLGCFDRNIEKMNLNLTYINNYISTTLINCSCYYYIASGNKEYANQLAKTNHLFNMDYVEKTIQNSLVDAFNTELIADINVMIHKNDAIMYYKEALNKFSSIDTSLEIGETSDFYWTICSNETQWTLFTCFGIDITLSKYYKKRLQDKIELINLLDKSMIL